MEARVLTVDEIMKLPHRSVVWEECNDQRAICPMIVTRARTLMDEDGEMPIDSHICEPKPLFIGGPLRRRFWTMKPTKKQREAVPWG